MLRTVVLVVFVGLTVGYFVHGKHRRLLNQDLQCVCLNKQSRRMNVKISLEESCKEKIDNFKPIDCKDILDYGYKRNGVYQIFPKGNVHGYKVYCDMTTDGGGWMVFQKRFNGSVDFYRTWEEYRNGFGDVYGEYWLGNEKIHLLTSSATQKLRVDLMDQAGIWKYASYSTFSISNNSTGYKLSAGKYTGNAGDSLTYHIGQTFKTKDNQSSKKCVERVDGAWWHLNCHHSNLNGLYNNKVSARGINWYHWHGYKYSLKATEMKLRRV